MLAQHLFFFTLRYMIEQMGYEPNEALEGRGVCSPQGGEHVIELIRFL